MKTNNLMKGIPIGTFVNMLTVLVGGSIGLYFQNIFPPNIQAILFQAIGLSTLLIGIKMSLKLPEGYLLILILSMISGGICGELLGIQEMLYGLGEWLKTSLNIGSPRFSEGLITTFLLFCVGSMTIIGSIEEGLHGKRELLFVKSTMDGLGAIAFASTYGVGVIFSIFPMFIMQGSITMLAGRAQKFFTPIMLDMLSATGGLLILAIGINMLQLGKISIENLLPALLFGVLFTFLKEWVDSKRRKE